ncbi:MAG: hypothetical protein IJZ70_06645 [Bacteroidales bacterium]|nr:hypothetical protein [Bacteroidales bacterium]MBQ8811971.1 hypothetical protein [Bacteroidales bacterium]
MGLRFTSEKDLQCKHCGFVKPRLDLYCYFLWDDAKWSDKRELSPSKAFPAPVQFCPNCKRFYYIDAEDVLIDDMNKYNWIKPLSYDNLLPSIGDWFNFDWSPKTELKQRLLLLWTFNDKFYRNSTVAEPSETDINVAMWNLLSLAKLLNDPIMVAEVFREAKKYSWCLKVAENAVIEDDMKHIMDKIQALAQKGDNKPFKISE